MTTCGAQPLHPAESADPVGAALWGFGRALGAEHRELYGGLIDLDPAVDAMKRAAALAEALRASSPERASAARGDTWYVPRLEVAPPPAPASPAPPQGTCLISGGLGGIGLEVASRLVERGCRSLVLLGRSTPPAEGGEAHWAPVRTALARLRAAGAMVRVAAVDVADRAAVERLARELKADGVPPVRAMYHAAGVLQYAPLAEFAAETLREVLAPKVAGALHLADVFSGQVERVVFFSSNSAVLPSPLMAGYAAANAFLDALAARLRTAGIAATSINWGTWGEAGMATRFVGRESGNVLTALRTLSTAEALDAMERTLAAELSRVVVMRMDWAEWQRLYPDFVRDPLFSNIVLAPDARPAEVRARLDAERLRHMPPAEQRAAISDFLAACIGDSLGMPPSDLDRTRGINLLGFDSLMALEIKNNIETKLGVLLPTVRLLEGPCIDELTDELSNIWAARSEKIREPALAWVEGEI